MQDDDTNPHADYFTPGVTHAAPATFPRPSTPPGVPLPPVPPLADTDPTTRFRRPAVAPGRAFTASDFTVEPEAHNPLGAPERATSGVYAAPRGAR